MSEWEMRYKTLLAGITDQRMVDNAERLVSSAIRLAATTGWTAEDTFGYLLQAVNVISRNAVLMAAVGIVGVETNANAGTPPQASEVPEMIA